MREYRPDVLFAGYPTTDEFQHMFLGLVTRKLPGGVANPAYDDSNLDHVRDHRVDTREGYLVAAYKGADRQLKLARDLMGRDPTTFVSSDHGFAPQFAAIDASKVAGRPRPAEQAPDLQLPDPPPARRSARRRPAGPAAPCRSTSTSPAAIRS